MPVLTLHADQPGASRAGRSQALWGRELAFGQSLKHRAFSALSRPSQRVTWQLAQPPHTGQNTQGGLHGGRHPGSPKGLRVTIGTTSPEGRWLAALAHHIRGQPRCSASSRRGSPRVNPPGWLGRLLWAASMLQPASRGASPGCMQGSQAWPCRLTTDDSKHYAASHPGTPSL